MKRIDKIKDMLGYVRELIENIQESYDITGYQAIIKYKNGTIRYISENEEIEKICLNSQKINYIVYETPDDNIDTNGKSFINDFCYGNIPTEETQETWNRYIISNL